MEIRGIAAAPGLVIGPVMVLIEPVIPDMTALKIGRENVEKEIAGLQAAIQKADRQIAAIRDRAAAKGQQDLAEVMDAHLMMVGDPVLAKSFQAAIEQQLMPAVGAVQAGIEKQALVFEKLDDAYFRERAQDVRDIGSRLVKILMGLEDTEVGTLSEPIILVARDIAPSLLAAADQGNLLAIVAEIGGKTSHTAILAASMGIPAVLGCDGIAGRMAQLEPGARIVVDGSKGIVVLDAGDDQLTEYEHQIRRRNEIRLELAALRDLPARTLDGETIILAANAMGPGDLKRIIESGAYGVGLYRTEFLFMDRSRAPDEEEQYRAYRDLVEGLDGKPVIIRTMDIGGDKAISYLGIGKEENPFLGYRALRICLDRPELFLVQLRAILRAGAHGQVLIMFPMVSSAEELRAAREFVEKAKADLRRQGAAFSEQVQVGIMIEVPSAALTADILIREADFFSIGSNDLTQYTLAVDRMNPMISKLYNSFHPAMIRIIKQVIDAGLLAGGSKFTGMCGEMAGDPKATMLLVGLGLQEFSVSPANLPKIKKIIRSISLKQAKEVAARALEMTTAQEIEAWLTHSLPADLIKYDI